MSDHITPYIKLEQSRTGGFGGITIQEDVELTDSDRESKETDTLQVNNKLWDSLFTIDLESCFLSYYAPCHVVGKLSHTIGIGYPSLFCLYAFFFFVFNYSYYVFAYAITPVCISNHFSDWCFLIYDKSQCKKTYTIINKEYLLCNYDAEYHMCYASNEACITEHDSKVTWGAWCFLEVVSISILSISHVYIRRNLKKKQRLPQDSVCKDIMYSFYCSTCSLAQQYRSLENEKDIKE